MKFKELSYKKKKLLLAVCCIFVAAFGYEFLFSEIMYLNREVESKEEKIQWLSDKESELPLLKLKMQEFEKIYHTTDTSEIRAQLMAYIANYTETGNCILVSMPKPAVFAGSNLIVQTNSFTLTGDFKSLLQLLSQIEKHFQFLARIVSAKFYTQKTGTEKMPSLYLAVVTQSFKKASR